MELKLKKMKEKFKEQNKLSASASKKAAEKKSSPVKA